MASTLKLSTGSVKAALRKAGVAIAEMSDATGRCTKEGAYVRSVNHAFAHGRGVRSVAWVSWRTVSRHTYRPMTDEERAAYSAMIEEKLILMSTALILIGYAVTFENDPFRRELTVTLRNA